MMLLYYALQMLFSSFTVPACGTLFEHDICPACMLHNTLSRDSPFCNLSLIFSMIVEYFSNNTPGMCHSIYSDMFLIHMSSFQYISSYFGLSIMHSRFHHVCVNVFIERVFLIATIHDPLLATTHVMPCLSRNILVIRKLSPMVNGFSQ